MAWFFFVFCVPLSDHCPSYANETVGLFYHDICYNYCNVPDFADFAFF